MSATEIHTKLQQVFGHATFRLGQEEIIRRVLAGEHVLAVMPTGAGKSLCFQLPAVILPGLTIVVSPLVSLIHDQVARLKRAGIRAASITGAQGEADRSAAEALLAADGSRVVYVSPERFRSAGFWAAIAGTRPELVAVDEAHCVSEWGYSFRPDYERLGEMIEKLAPKRLIALTATATPDVRGDIARTLKLKDPHIAVFGFDRPNIHFEVHAMDKEAEKKDSVVSFVRGRTPAIVYSATRSGTGELTLHLKRNGIRAAAYHAGLSPEVREDCQKRFAEGKIDVVVATNAFGLGIDKSDVRLVVHAEFPRSLEAYYQEVGRAGRDGKPAIGGLIFMMRDIYLQKFLLETTTPPPALVSNLFAKLKLAGRPLAFVELTGGSKEPAMAAAVRHLESLGLVERRWGPRLIGLELVGPVVTTGESPKAALSRAIGGPKGTLEEPRLMAAVGATTTAELAKLLGDLERSGDLRRTSPERAALYAAPAGGTLTPEHLNRLKLRNLREKARLEQMLRLVQGRRCRRQALLEALGETGVRASCGACDVCAGHRLEPVRHKWPGASRRVSGRSDTVSGLSAIEGSQPTRGELARMTPAGRA